MQYSQKVMDHFMNPRNVGEIDNASGIGEVGNAKCGDIMRVYLQIDNDVISDVKFKTFGCGSATELSTPPLIPNITLFFITHTSKNKTRDSPGKRFILLLQCHDDGHDHHL